MPIAPKTVSLKKKLASRRNLVIARARRSQQTTTRVPKEK